MILFSNRLNERETSWKIRESSELCSPTRANSKKFWTSSRCLPQTKDCVKRMLRRLGLVRIPKLGSHIIRNINKSIYFFIVKQSYFGSQWEWSRKGTRSRFQLSKHDPAQVKTEYKPARLPTLCCSVSYRLTSPSLANAQPHYTPILPLLHAKQMIPTLRVPVTRG